MYGTNGQLTIPNGSQDYAVTPQYIPDNDVSLRDIYSILRRRRGVILTSCAIAMIGGLAATAMMKPVYRSSARIVVEPRSVALKQVEVSGMLGALAAPPGTQDVQTQLELLKDPALLTKACAKAGVSAEDVGLSARQVNDTNVIEVIADASSPSVAERTAAALPSVYHQYVVEMKRSSGGQALAFSRERLREERRALEKAENELKRFRAGNRIANVEKQRDARIAEQSAAVAEENKAEADSAALAKQLDTLKGIRRAAPTSVINSSTSPNPATTSIREQIASLQTERASLTVLYKPNHTSVIALDARIADLQSRLNREPQNTTSVTRVPNPALAVFDEKIDEAQAALAARKAALQRSQVHRLRVESDLSKYSGWELTNAKLMRTVSQHEASVALLTRAVDELSLRDEANRIAEPPLMEARPAEQVAPRPFAYMVVALLSGLIVGLMLALLWEHLDDGTHSEQEVVGILQAPILAYLPSGQRDSRRGSRAEALLLENIRMLRTNLRFISIDNPPHSMLVSSATPGEGKSFTARHLALAYTLDGKQVVLVDSDLRNPVIHEAFGLPCRPGLTDVLVGDLSLDEALQDSGTKGLKILTAGTFTSSPTELLSSQRMETLIESLNQLADIVIYDGPPLTGAADAQILSAYTDGVLHVVDMGRVRKSGLIRSVDLLYHARANIIGIVLNRADGETQHSGYYPYMHRGALSASTRSLPSTDETRDPASQAVRQ